MPQIKRIKEWAQFQQLMAYPPVARSQHFVVHRGYGHDVSVPPAGAENAMAQASLLKGLCMATLIPKRWAKRAVTRNAMKRQIMAAFSNEQKNLLPVPHLVRLQSSFDTRVFNSASSASLKIVVAQEVGQLLKRLVRP